MKKIILFIVICISLLVLSPVKCYAYDNVDTLKEYALAAQRLNTTINFIVKNSIRAKENKDTKLIDEYKKDIKNVDSEIGRTLKLISDNYTEYKSDSDISNGLLYLGIIFSDYRFVMNTLNTYLNSDDIDITYNSLKQLFAAILDAERKLETLK